MQKVLKIQYDVWKNDKFLFEIPEEVLNKKIGKLIIDLSIHYGLVGVTDNDVNVICDFVLKFLAKYPKWKLIDIDRSIELYKKRPELNKLCPEYFEQIFKKYIGSEERKAILKEYDFETGSGMETKIEPTPEELLKRCYDEYKRTGNIFLGSGKVYEYNFKLLIEKLGMDQMSDIKTKTAELLIAENEREMYKPENLKNKDYYFKQLSDITFDKSVTLKVETRKAHLKRYFDIIG